MSWRAVIIVLAIVFIGGVLLFAAVVQLPTVDDKALAERCASSAPSWQGYAEEIKGQVGAAPVAEWNGDVVAADFRNGQLRIHVDLTGPWVDRPFAIPILVRDPYGKVHLGRRVQGEGAARAYIVDIPGGGALTWVEVATPDGRHRITLGPDQSWSAG
jgi:hypothetical protein